MELHALPLAARSYALLLYYYMCYGLEWDVMYCQERQRMLINEEQAN